MRNKKIMRRFAIEKVILAYENNFEPYRFGEAFLCAQKRPWYEIQNHSLRFCFKVASRHAEAE